MPDIKKDNPNIEKDQPGKNADVEKDVPAKKGPGENEDIERQREPSDIEKQGSSEDKGYTHK